ncbi:hypothetical protein F4818DRAFT_421138 [Hypoxylon cercidicola]|nr:hypothetical protein F4818DRAFT_421138 [Hypoxylon cercidicola]
MLDEMNPHKERRSSDSPAIMAKKPEREFENVNLLRSLMGDSKKETSGRSAMSTLTSSEQFSYQRNSTDGLSAPNTSNSQIQPPVLSPENDHGKPAGQPPSISTAPPPYRTSSFPRMTVPGSVSSQCQADLSDHSYKSLVVLRSSSSPSSYAASPQIQKSHTRPVSEPNPGLNALFQQPVRLKPYSTSGPTGSGLHTTGESGLRGASLQDSLSTTSSMTSLRSHVSEWGTYSESSRPLSQASQHSTMQHRPVPASHSSDLGIKAVQNLKGKTSKDSPVMELRNQRIALSCLSAYHAQISDQATHVIEPVSLNSGDGDLPSFEGELKRVTAERTRPGSPSSNTTDTDSLASSESMLATQCLDSGLMTMTPEIVSRRYVADSQAWQRKSRMLQVDCPNDCAEGS